MDDDVEQFEIVAQEAADEARRAVSAKLAELETAARERWPIDRIGEAGLPTLFAKLAARGQEWRRAA